MTRVTPTEAKLDRIIRLLEQLVDTRTPAGKKTITEVLNLPYPAAALQALADSGYTLERR